MPRITTPKIIDLSPQMPPVGDQGEQWSCCTWALCYGIQSFLMKKKNRWSYILKSKLKEDRVFSPAFVFNSVKAGSGDTDIRHGINFDKAKDFVNNHGSAFLKDFPYDSKRCDKVPDASVLAKAHAHKLPLHESFPNYDVESFRKALKRKYIIFVAINVEDHFRKDGNDAWKKKLEFTYIPTGKGDHIGIHCMVCVGFDDGKKVFKMMNSYGSHWGNDGYVNISYNDLESLIVEAYSFPY